MLKLKDMQGLEDLRDRIQKKLHDENNRSEDTVEIGRSTSYAFFDELKKRSENNKITIDDFKSSLSARGVQDNDFQEKILTTILQNRVGLQFKIGSYVGKHLLQNSTSKSVQYWYDQDDISTDLQINKENNRKVFLTVNVLIKDKKTDTRIANISIQLSITPNDIIMTQYKVNTLNRSQSAKDVYELLKLKKDSLLQRIINWFKRLLGFQIKNEAYPNFSLEKQAHSPKI